MAVRKSSILKWSALINRLRSFRLKMNLSEPSFLGLKKYEERNWFEVGVHISIAFFCSNFSIAVWYLLKSLLSILIVGVTVCVGFWANFILYPWIEFNTNVSFVMACHFGKKCFNRPAELTFIFSLFSVGTSISITSMTICSCCWRNSVCCCRGGCPVDPCFCCNPDFVWAVCTGCSDLKKLCSA